MLTCVFLILRNPPKKKQKQVFLQKKTRVRLSAAGKLARDFIALDDPRRCWLFLDCPTVELFIFFKKRKGKGAKKVK